MTKHLRMMALISIFAITAGCQMDQSTSASDTKAANAEMNREANAALQSLYAKTPQARDLAKRAKGILVFPDVLKAGLIAGAQHGEGELIENGKVTGYYATTAASYGLQAGVQRFGYVMFFMTYSAMNDLKTQNGPCSIWLNSPRFIRKSRCMYSMSSRRPFYMVTILLARWWSR